MMNKDIRSQFAVIYKEKVIGTAEKATRALAVRALAGLGDLSPVLSGHFRNNWNISVGSPDFAIKPEPAPGQQAPAPDYASVAAVELQSYTLGPTIWIVNNLSYAQRLNDGYSDKAPAGFVEIAVDLAESNTKAAVKRGEYSK